MPGTKLKICNLNEKILVLPFSFRNFNPWIAGVKAETTKQRKFFYSWWPEREERTREEEV